MGWEGGSSSIGEREAGTFPIKFFEAYHFYIQKLLYHLQNCVMHLKKLFFSATIILWKKVILSCLKMNLKTSHKLR